MKWNSALGEFLKAQLEPENKFEKCDAVVGHLSKWKTSRFAKTISFFLCGSNENSCKVEVTGKIVNLGDWEGIWIPCNLHFIGDGKYIDKLKDILRKLL